MKAGADWLVGDIGARDSDAEREVGRSVGDDGDEGAGSGSSEAASSII